MAVELLIGSGRLSTILGPPCQLSLFTSRGGASSLNTRS
jgi:hypothetical protein